MLLFKFLYKHCNDHGNMCLDLKVSTLHSICVFFLRHVILRTELLNLVSKNESMNIHLCLCQILLQSTYISYHIKSYFTVRNSSLIIVYKSLIYK